VHSSCRDMKIRRVEEREAFEIAVKKIKSKIGMKEEGVLTWIQQVWGNRIRIRPRATTTARRGSWPICSYHDITIAAVLQQSGPLERRSRTPSRGRSNRLRASALSTLPMDNTIRQATILHACNRAVRASPPAT